MPRCTAGGKRICPDWLGLSETEARRVTRERISLLADDERHPRRVATGADTPRLNLDIFWLKDTSLEDADSLPEPDVLAQEIAEDLQAAMELFAAIANRGCAVACM